MAGINLIEVSKNFGEHAAVSNLTLEILDGECVALVGPSGCGKTTTLRIIAGLEHANEGDVRIAGRSVTRLEPHQRDVAMVFQSYALYPAMSVEQNLGFPLKMAGVHRSERRARVLEIAEVLDLKPLLGRRPNELSGGQRQRVAMGRALVRRPSAFLMDEPLSNLDAMLRVQMRAELASFQRRQGITTVYVTHDQVEAMTLGNRIAVMNEGSAQQVGTPEQIYRHPSNLFVAAFVGSPRMNLMRAQVEKGVLRVGALVLPLPEGVSPSARAVFAGVRPEHLSVSPSEGTSRLIADVEVVERLGSESYLYLRIDGLEAFEVGERSFELRGAFAARVDPWSPIREGEKVCVTVDPCNVHVFEETGERSVALGG